MKIYRTAANLRDALLPGGFWTDDRRYAEYIHPHLTVYEAELPDAAHVHESDDELLIAFGEEMPQEARAVLDGLRAAGYDAAQFQAWDWACDEYAVFRPEVLSRVRRKNR